MGGLCRARGDVDEQGRVRIQEYTKALRTFRDPDDDNDCGYNDIATILVHRIETKVRL